MSRNFPPVLNQRSLLFHLRDYRQYASKASDCNEQRNQSYDEDTISIPGNSSECYYITLQCYNITIYYICYYIIIPAVLSWLYYTVFDLMLYIKKKHNEQFAADLTVLRGTFLID